MTLPERARAYLAKLPFAIAGSGGHAATFAAACRLVEFGLSEADAWELFREWNESHCQPPWTEGELRHKLTDAFHRTSPKERFTLGKPQLASPAPARTAALKRPVLPMLIPGRAEHLSALATLRGLSLAAVTLASRRGLLRFGEYRGHVAWFILDQSQRTAQARRLDGQPWAQQHGIARTAVKTWTLAGSQAAWPVGIGEAAPFASLALCEGGPDLLAACHFIAAEDRVADAAPVAMLGSACAIHADALPLFRGKRVRIFRHVDEAGDMAACRWAEQLTEAGADVDAFAFDGLRRDDDAPVNDLNDAARIHPDDFAAHPSLAQLIP